MIKEKEKIGFSDWLEIWKKENWKKSNEITIGLPTQIKFKTEGNLTYRVNSIPTRFPTRIRLGKTNTAFVFYLIFVFHFCFEKWYSAIFFFLIWILKFSPVFFFWEGKF
jgi:hypothetical protein